MDFEAEPRPEGRDGLLDCRECGRRVLRASRVDDQRQPLVLDPQRRIAATQRVGELLAQGGDLGRLVRGRQLAVAPGLEAVQARHDDAWNRVEAAEAHRRFRGPAGDHRDLRPSRGQLGQRRQSPRHRPGLLRIELKRRQSPVEVGGDQGVRKLWSYCRDNLGHIRADIHRYILAHVHGSLSPE